MKINITFENTLLFILVIISVITLTIIIIHFNGWVNYRDYLRYSSSAAGTTATTTSNGDDEHLKFKTTNLLNEDLLIYNAATGNWENIPSSELLASSSDNNAKLDRLFYSFTGNTDEIIFSAQNSYLHIQNPSTGGYTYRNENFIIPSSSTTGGDINFQYIGDKGTDEGVWFNVFASANAKRISGQGSSDVFGFQWELTSGGVSYKIGFPFKIHIDTSETVTITGTGQVYLKKHDSIKPSVGMISGPAESSIIVEDLSIVLVEDNK